jgi:hypothetical protein
VQILECAAFERGKDPCARFWDALKYAREQRENHLKELADLQEKLDQAIRDIEDAQQVIDSNPEMDYQTLSLYIFFITSQQNYCDTLREKLQAVDALFDADNKAILEAEENIRACIKIRRQACVPKETVEI